MKLRGRFRIMGAMTPGDPFNPVRAPDGYVVSARDRLASAGGMNFGTALVVFAIAETVIIIAVVGAVSPSSLAFVLPFVVGAPFIIFGLINQIMWAPMARRFPARPQAPDAVVRTFQSVAFSRLNRINNFVHIAADADHLHFIAPGLMRATGAKVISIPWERFTDVKQRGLFGMTGARVDGRAITAPTWCMKVALAQAAAMDDAGPADAAAAPTSGSV